MTAGGIDVTFLQDGAQPAAAAASIVAGFIAQARRSLDFAIYDLRLDEATARQIIDAVHAATARGVRARIAFNNEHRKRPPVPPAPRVDWDVIKALDIAFYPVNGVPDLMHHKYVVRDAGTDEAAVLTGSTNWTSDSWTREENVIATIPSRALADSYAADFEQIWQLRQVRDTGTAPPVWVELPGGIPARALFSPGGGRKMAHVIAQHIDSAQTRLRVVSPVITAGAILGTLSEVRMRPGLDIGGVVDLTQMDEVRYHYTHQAGSTWKLPALDGVLGDSRFAGKRSVPYAPGSVHDFMHAKFVVSDDTVVFGSYNLSASGMDNAENVVEVRDAALATRFADFADQVRARYGGAPLPGPP